MQVNPRVFFGSHSINMLPMSFNIQIFSSLLIYLATPKDQSTPPINDIHAYNTREVFMHHLHRYLVMNYMIKWINLIYSYWIWDICTSVVSFNIQMIGSSFVIIAWNPQQPGNTKFVNTTSIYTSNTVLDFPTWLWHVPNH